MRDFIKTEIIKLQTITQQILDDKNIILTVEKIVKECIDCYKNGNKILFAGNGGSAADSQHLAAELVSRLKFNRAGLAAIAITTDTSILTAIGNDYGFETLFSRQIEALGNKGDVFFAISTSGNSANIIQAINTAKTKKIKVIGLTGQDGGKMADICDFIIKIPTTDTAKIQECHIMLGHTICALIEKKIFS